jgi:hypothetical protein
MIERILIVSISFILGVVFVRIWDGWITRRRLEMYLREMVDKSPNPPLPPV